jgi:hypothetical protein
MLRKVARSLEEQKESRRSCKPRECPLRSASLLFLLKQSSYGRLKEWQIAWHPPPPLWEADFGKGHQTDGNYAKFFRLGELCKFWSTGSTDAAEEWRLSSNLLGMVQLTGGPGFFPRVSRMVVGLFRQDTSRLAPISQ